MQIHQLKEGEAERQRDKKKRETRTGKDSQSWPVLIKISQIKMKFLSSFCIGEPQ